MRSGGCGGGVQGGGVTADAKSAHVWGVMLRQAQAMGILPEAFWRLSLREWRMLTESAGGGVRLPRGVFDEMMERWPDGGRV